jgi:tetratricopeptide (TPR) repeat protein/tRNA A-37 threonylcarbamoyl transferase component Bud32
MSPERFQRLETLYDRAAALPEGERTRFIDEQCAGDEELRRELMAAFRDAGSGLTGVVRQAAAAASGSEDHGTARPAREEPLQMAAPLRIGPYQLMEEIGRGAMGVVFRAFDPAIGRAVAIKIIRSDPFAPPLEKDELRRRFAREAGAAGRLSHPGIVTIFQLGNDGDHDYLVMELIAGQCLEQLLVPGIPAEIPKTVSVLRQLAAALDYAHGQGVIHRDIKPANILVGLDGTVKIGDFGIARILSSTMTQTGAVLGTPSYMAPEQIMARRIGAAADQFSLAVLAYQMLTGRRPFEGSSTTEVMYQIVHAEPQPVCAANPALPPAVDDVFRRALSKDPDRRYAKCAEFVAALEQQLAAPAVAVSGAQLGTQAVVPDRPPAVPSFAAQAVPEDALPWWKRHRVLVAAALGACPALVLAYFLVSPDRPAKQIPAKVDAVATAGPGASRGRDSAPVSPVVSGNTGTGVRPVETGAGGRSSTRIGSSATADPAAVFKTGVGPFRFGMQPGEVLRVLKGWNVWAGDPGSVVSGRLPKADEYNPADVRYIGYALGRLPAPSASGSALHSLAALQPCWGPRSMLYFLFSGDGLFKISVRLVEPCTDRTNLVTRWASQYGVAATGSSGHLKFRKTVGPVTLEGHYLTSAFIEIYKSGSPAPAESWWLSVLQAPDAIARSAGGGNSTPTTDGADARAAEVKHVLGVQLLNQRKYPEAVAALTEAINLAPNFAEAYLDRCRAYQSVPLLDRAIEDCDHAIKLKPAYPEAFFHRAWARVRQQKPDQAADDFSEAIRLNPDYEEAYIARATAAPRPFDLAIQDLTQAIRLRPSDPVAYFRRAEKFGAQKDYDRAIKDLDEAIRLWPTAYYWRYRGDMYRFQGKYQRAIQDYDENTQRHPNDALSYQARAAAKDALGDKDGAAADRKRAEELKTAH